jgi:hypothetical protein
VSKKNQQAVVFSHAVICEDIRFEHNGKLMLIGVFSGHIVMANIPTALNFALACFGNINAPFHSTFGIRVTDDRKEPLFQVDPMGEFGAVETGPVTFTIPTFGFVVPRPTTLRFEIKVGDNPWKLLIEKQARIGKMPPHPLERPADPKV